MSKRTILKRFLKTGLVVLVLTASLAVSLATAPRAEAATAAQVNGLRSLEDARDLFKIDGDDAPKFAWQPSPPPKKPTDAKAGQVSIFVCEQTVSACSAGTPGAVQFRLTGIHHEDRRTGGLDNWDFIFKPYRGDTLIQTKLQLVYRANTSGTRSAGLVWGDPGGDALLKNLVGQLNGFDETEFGEGFLDKLRNDEGLQWAKQAGLETSTDQTSLADRASTDPFSLALEKVAEVITSLIGSVTSAVAWAIDAGTLMNNDGLARAWTVVRDLVNVLFILVLTAMAFMSIVRLEPQKYNVHQLLPLLVFSIIAVNFSFLFASILANTAAVLSQPFLEQAHEFIKEAAGVGSGYSDGLVDGFGEAVVLLVASIVILISLVVLLFFLVARIIVLWVLAVLSPVVFLFLVLPLTRGESKNLLTTYIQWVYLAPIAMLLLFAGSLMLNSALQGTDTGDPGGSAILQAIFFAGITIAAVMVPIGMGGRIAQILSKQGSKYGKVGGKGGLGVAGMMPLGRGMTVGEAARTGRAALKLRKAGQEERAEERAAYGLAQLNESLGGQGLASSVTGFDAGQSQPLMNDLVDKQLKRAMLGGMNEANFYRMVAHKMSQNPNLSTREQAMVGQIRNDWGEASLEERRMADNHIGELAAAKGLAQSGYMEWDMLPRYARYGYQEAMGKYNPLLSAVKKNYRGGAIDGQHIDMGRVAVAVGSAGADDQRTYIPDFWQSVEGGSEFAQRSTRTALDEFRDTIRERTSTPAIGAIMDPLNRVAASDTRREAIAGIRQRYFRPDVVKVIEESDRKLDNRRRGFQQYT